MVGAGLEEEMIKWEHRVGMEGGRHVVRSEGQQISFTPDACPVCVISRVNQERSEAREGLLAIYDWVIRSQELVHWLKKPLADAETLIRKVMGMDLAIGVLERGPRPDPRDVLPARAAGPKPSGKMPFTCPVCNGAGTVSRPPSVAGDQAWWVASTGTDRYPCKACNANGIVWGEAGL
jgi:hypothetical protein